MYSWVFREMKIVVFVCMLCIQTVFCYEEGDIVLIGGSRPSEGTVLIMLDGNWGTICDSHWDFRESGTVCRQLGYKKSLPAYNAFYGETTSNSHRIDMDCPKVKNRLIGCRVKYWSRANCGKANAAGVQCQPHLDVGESGVEVRLVENTTRNAGGVELKVKGRWGAVCGHVKSQNWRKNIAQWACKKLGFTGRDFPMSMPMLDVFPKEERKVWADRVWCSNNFTAITDCIQKAWGNAYECESDYMAGVRCDPDIYPDKTPFEYRLVNRPHDRAGMLEVLQYGIWGPVSWGDVPFNATQLICKEEGYEWGGYYGELKGSSIYSPDKKDFSGSVWTATIKCEENATRFEECVKSAWTRKSIEDGDRTWIECFTKPHAMLPVLESNPQRITAGDDVTLSCYTGNGNQLPYIYISCVEWRCNECHSMKSVIDGNMIYKNMTLRADEGLNGKGCSCGALSPSYWFPHTRLAFNITYGPVKMSMTVSNPIREYHQVNVTCNVTNTNPIPQLFWYHAGELIDVQSPINITRDNNKGFNLLQQYSFVASRSQTGKRIKCVAYNPVSGQTGTRSKVITVDTVPEVTATISPPSVGVGEESRFSCLVRSEPQVNGIWRRSSGEIVSATETFILQEVEGGDAGQYRCYAKGVHGEVTSDWASLSVIGIIS